MDGHSTPTIWAPTSTSAAQADAALMDGHFSGEIVELSLVDAAQADAALMDGHVVAPLRGHVAAAPPRRPTRL